MASSIARRSVLTTTLNPTTCCSVHNLAYAFYGHEFAYKGCALVPLLPAALSRRQGPEYWPRLAADNLKSKVNFSKAPTIISNIVDHASHDFNTQSRSWRFLCIVKKTQKRSDPRCSAGENQEKPVQKHTFVRQL